MPGRTTTTRTSIDRSNEVACQDSYRDREYTEVSCSIDDVSIVSSSRWTTRIRLDSRRSRDRVYSNTVRRENERHHGEAQWRRESHLPPNSSANDRSVHFVEPWLPPYKRWYCWTRRVSKIESSSCTYTSGQHERALTFATRTKCERISTRFFKISARNTSPWTQKLT